MANKKDSLGDRMKTYYENRTRNMLPRRTYTIIRIDGKAFHSYCRGLNKPFDLPFIEDMDETAKYLCKNIQGAKFAFVQSDEISILLTDFDNLKTNAWFDGNVQKMCSVSASLATRKFNQLRVLRFLNNKLKNNITIELLDEISKLKQAEFDSRVFTIPSKYEVYNYFIWRQQDTVRNSISSLAQSLYSHSELNGKNTDIMQELCFKKGVNWNEYDPKLKRGRFIMNESYQLEDGALRNRWESVQCPTFTQQPSWLLNQIMDNI